MKSIITLSIYLILLSVPVQGQLLKRDDEIAASQSKKGKNASNNGNPTIQGIEQRAFTTHNRSNLGMFIENRGKLYARSSALGLSGEFPVNSLQEYIYQMNPFVLFPGNVIQSRNSGNEEWEAEFGYNVSGSTNIAVSTDPSTWPASGWPVKDSNGNAIFVSDQDTYSVFNDSLNREGVLGISVVQRGYSFSFPLVRDAVIFRYDVINRSSNNYTGMYFGLYHDIDVGNAAGVGDPEYDDDRIGYDEDIDMLYFYDDGKTVDWIGGQTGHFGVSYVSTPEINGSVAGLTDWHYNLYADTPYWDDDDNVAYGIMTSNYAQVPADVQSRFFHPVEQGRRKDNPATIPSSGLDIAAHSASGPYTIGPGDTLSFVIAVVAGRNYAEIRSTTENIHASYDANWVLPKAPDKPLLQAYAEKDKVVLRWDDRSEKNPDPFSNTYDFKGYKLYRSINNGLTWDQYDRNIFPDYGSEPVPLAVFDKDDSAIQYSFVDSTVQEGFTYWYSLTAYDYPIPVVGSLETSIGNTSDEPNITIVTPKPNSTDWVASVTDRADHTDGLSTDTLFLRVIDPLNTLESEYTVNFTRIVIQKAGNLRTTITSTPIDAVNADPTSYLVSWSADNVFRVRNENAARNRFNNVAYVPGQVYSIAQDNIEFTFIENSTEPDLRPQAGDELQIVTGFNVTRNSDGEIVLPTRVYERDIEFITSDGVGVVFKHNPFTVVSSSTTLKASIENPDYAGLLSRPYSITVTGVMGAQSDSLLLSVSENNGNAIADTVQNGGLVSFSRFDVRLTADLTNGASSISGATISITTVPVRNPNEGDVFSYTKSAGEPTVNPEKSVLKQINVVPNPYVVANAWERDISLQQREPERLIRFRNLPNSCTIHIFTIAGEKVKTLSKNDNSGILGWDLRTDSGREVAAGVYIYKVETSFGSHVSRFAIIK